MKTLLQSLFFLLLLKQICFAQWYQQNSGTTIYLTDVSFTDSSNGTAVGDSGTILRTTNGGQNWMRQTSGTTIMLSGVSFTDVNNGTVVGYSGTILRTTDGGQNWMTQISGTTNMLSGVSFTDTINGTTVGDSGIILRTTDGGQNWIRQTNGTNNFLFGVSFTDASNGFVVGVDVILKTTDGGQNWTLLGQQEQRLVPTFSGVSFTDSNNGTIVGWVQTFLGYFPILSRTTDGGKTWTPQDSGIIGPLWRVCFTDANYGSILGSVDELGDVKILRTSDGGQNWIIQSGGTTASLSGVSFTDANNGTVVGESGTILRTTNGGATFIEEEQIDEMPTTYFLSNNFPNPFNPSTKIEFSIPQSSNVIIKVFDILGNEIETLVNEEKPAGSYEVTWYAANLPSGVYFYQLKSGEYISTKKMLLLK